MDTGKKIFPVDISAVKGYDIKQWQDEFFWPVSDADFFLLYKDIEHSYRRFIDTEEHEISDLFLIQRNLVFKYWHFLHAVKVTQSLQADGYKLQCTERSLWYRNIVQGDYAVDSVLPKMRRIAFHRFLRTLDANLRCAAKGVVYNGDMQKIFSPAAEEKPLVCGPLNSLMKHYIKRSSGPVGFMSQREYSDGAGFSHLSGRLKKEIGRTSADAADNLSRISNDNGIRLKKEEIEYLRQVTEQDLLIGAELMRQIERSVSNFQKPNLLLASFGGPFYRALCTIIRRKGYKVTGFTHGGYIGLYDRPTLALSEFALSDEFITFTESSARLFEKNRDNNPSAKNNRPAIKWHADDYYLKIWERCNRKTPPVKIRRVMVVGYPYTQWRRPQSAAGLSLMHLDLELRVIEILQRAGYEVIYKPHPDTYGMSGGIFDSMVKIAGKRYIEDCLDDADAFLFGDIRTTAFPVALCSNKPVLAFSMKEEPFKPFYEALELLEKRCLFIGARFDDKNRVVFDEKELLDAFSAGPEPPNGEFLEKYYFPGKGE
jgi:hypothetical protein